MHSYTVYVFHRDTGTSDVHFIPVAESGKQAVEFIRDRQNIKGDGYRACRVNERLVYTVQDEGGKT